MNTTSALLIQRAVTELRLLPEFRKVLDFIGYLRSKRLSPLPAMGSPEALLAYWGKWQFNPNERIELDAYIQTTREMSDGRLPA